MPDLSTTLHLDMLQDFRRTSIALWQAVVRGYAPRERPEADIRNGALPFRLGANNTRLLEVADLERLYGNPHGDIYGMHWGDPETVQPLAFVKRRYVLPLLRSDFTGVEIGPGGGRWTQYLLGVQRLYLVDFHQELLDELSRRFTGPKLVPIKNNGTDFPGIGDAEADFVFSFDVFVHLDVPLIEQYLVAMKRILRPGARALIHYSDKNKIMAPINPGFSENDPATMRRLVTGLGYRIVEEDTTTMWHSSIIVIERP